MSSEDDILSAFDQTFRVNAALKEAGKPKVRRAAEKKHALKHDDGRSKRATGRTAQFNLKIRPDYKTRMVAAAKTHDVLLADLAELAFDLLLSELAAKDLAAIRRIAATKGNKR